jgi:hypothetical protein
VITIKIEINTSEADPPTIEALQGLARVLDEMMRKTHLVRQVEIVQPARGLSVVPDVSRKERDGQ